MIGYTDTYTKTRINIALNCWGLIVGTAAALLAPRFKRRTMFLTCTISMLVVYVGWTISMQQAIVSSDAHMANGVAAKLVLFFIFAYSPAYNIGNNALTYSAFSPFLPPLKHH